MPFNSQNEHCVVVVQDNCAIHHVKEALCGAGQYNAYSPDYNSIEECFYKVKSVLKAMEAHVMTLIATIVLSSAFTTVTEHFMSIM